MPSKSASQHRLMEAVAHDKGFAGKAGIPQKVGREFVAADRGTASPYRISSEKRNREDMAAKRKMKG